jgi:predicted ATPase
MEIDNSKKLFYTALRLSGTPQFETYDFENTRTLTNLSTVNIFVGANNSGKSRFLRSLFRTTNFGFRTNFFNGSEFRNFLYQTKSDYADEQLLEKCKLIEFDPPLIEHFQKGNEGYFTSSAQFTEQLRILVQQWQQFARNNLHLIAPGASQMWMNHMINVFSDQWQGAVHETSFSPKIGNEFRFYIPILRGMRPLQNTSSNEYRDRTVNDYFSELTAIKRPGENLDVFTGLELYENLKKQLLGEPQDRAAVRNFENFLKVSFFDGKHVTLIPKIDQDVVHIKIGTEAQFPIFLLGDGLQNLIIITYQMFMKKQRCLFFIEEPDLSMHPGMQRAFLEEMTRHNQHQYFLTTHSNHLLDMSSEFKEMSVYLFSKESKEDNTRFKVSQALSPDSNILKELGVRNSSVFLTNATIWVEGVTDRLYLRTYLNKYSDQAGRRKFREDYHFSFVEYQGSNLTHWTFDEKDQSTKIKANHLCGHSFLIADGDVSNKGTRRADYGKMLGERFYILNCKEIENLIPPEVLKEIVKDEFKRADKDVDLIDYSKYSVSEEGLGRYLDKLLGKDEFASESGTVKGKVNFCEKAIELMAQSDFEWKLTTPLNELCEKIYQFILKQNE